MTLPTPADDTNAAPAAQTFPTGAPVIAVNLAGHGFYYATMEETRPDGWLVVSDATGKTLELSAAEYTITGR